MEAINRKTEVKAFARHETFYVRYGWLTKIALNIKSLYETSDYAEIGVGKNMFNSMKYWGAVYKIVDRENNNGKSIKTTALVFDKDCFLENTSSLWVLHYESMLPTSLVPCWRSIFNNFKLDSFSQSSLEKNMVDYFANVYPEVSPKSIAKDVSCFIQTFVFKVANQVDDTKIMSPFSEIGILEESATNTNIYNFVYGRKESLRPEVVIWSIVRYLEEKNIVSATYDELSTAEDSPGVMFKLDTASLGNYINSIDISKYKGIYVNENIGKKIFSVDFRHTDSLSILEKVYK